MKDYYAILGVPRTATEEDIKRAFRKLAHQYHPDKSTGDEAKFKEINEAYQTLGNKDKRTVYNWENPVVSQRYYGNPVATPPSPFKNNYWGSSYDSARTEAMKSIFEEMDEIFRKANDDFVNQVNRSMRDQQKSQWDIKNVKYWDPKKGTWTINT